MKSSPENGSRHVLQADARNATAGIGAVRLSSVLPCSVKWLWPPYVPRGKITLLEGNPDQGKTHLALWLAAHVSRGSVPGGGEGPRSVLVLTGEDGIADTIRPRLESYGCDLSLVHAVVEPWRVQLKRLENLMALVDEIEPSLVIVDPLLAFLGAEIDLHRGNETRPVIARVAHEVEARGVALVGIRHLAKSGSPRATLRGLGSVDISAAVRSILLFAEHPDDQQLRVLAHAKSNLAPKGPSIEFEWAGDRLAVRGECRVTADQLLASLDNARAGGLTDACDLLRRELGKRPRPQREIADLAEEEGISRRTLARARKSLKVQATRQGEPGRRGGGQWILELPVAATEPTV